MNGIGPTDIARHLELGRHGGWRRSVYIGVGVISEISERNMIYWLIDCLF